MPLKIAFMGTPHFAVPSLRALIEAGHQVAMVYTQPPRPAGRGMAERKSPVHLEAEAQHLQVSTPASMKDATVQDQYRQLGADAAVVVAYGQILPRAVLEIPRLGSFNLHASALPRWRGAAPIQRAIMAGDASTAVMVMRMEEGLDTGPICLSRTIAIGPETTAGELHDELAAAGAPLLVEAMSALERGELVARPQSGNGVTYATKISKAEGKIDFFRPAGDVHNLIRGLAPFPGAWLEFSRPSGEPERVKILRSALAEGGGEPGTIIDDQLTVACAAGAVRLVELQRSGKRPMPAEEFLRGFPLAPGARVNHS